MAKLFLMMASISGLLAVAIGAFGAHGLKQKLPPDLLAIYQTGVEYHFYHTLALLAVGLLVHLFPQTTAFKFSGWFMVSGMIIFSGSLYLLAITGTRWLGAITPLGGIALLLAWAAMTVGVYQSFSR